MPLMQALKLRRSAREYLNEELPLSIISDMLWAACGVNRASSGKRTAPSARDNREIDIYVTTAFGVYVYDPDAHILSPVAAGDIRAKTGKQKFAATAAVNLVYVADYSRAKGISKDDRRFYGAADAGFVGQNVYLFCASRNLATVVRGWIDRETLAPALHLNKNQEIILAQSVGYPAKQ
ncbi:MAG: SagB/ThcOx family dehydrogenase [Chitinivibrionales bacterium]|nr:SagB/ThcOx family dehydrogenase [Chitinivibrionales bacterium]MBD3396865.1 SagB/ThcOx family dehydrogenase [Chitinivibrionales bacterium]